MEEYSTRSSAGSSAGSNNSNNSNNSSCSSSEMLAVALELKTHHKGITKLAEKQEASILRLQLSFPPQIDAEQANLAAALLFERMDRSAPALTVQRIKLSNLSFASAEALQCWKDVLMPYVVDSITHVTIKNCNDPDAWDVWQQLFVVAGNNNNNSSSSSSSPICNLNLSENDFSSSSINNKNLRLEQWLNRPGLQQLILDHVRMDEASAKQMAALAPVYGPTLTNLFVVVTLQQQSSKQQQDTTSASAAATPAGTSLEGILEHCPNLQSLRWTHYSSSSTPQDKTNTNAAADAEQPCTTIPLPWYGLRQSTLRLSGSNSTSPMQHLVLDGSTPLTVSELGPDGLTGALESLPNLRTLKLRNMGLRDAGVRAMVNALLHASAKHNKNDNSNSNNNNSNLEWLDLSGNEITNVQALDALLEQTAFTLEVIVLEQNQLDNAAALHILQSTANHNETHSVEIELRLEDNPCNLSQLALDMAQAESRASRERAELRRKYFRTTADTPSLRSLVAERTAMNNKLRKLQTELEVVKHEREILKQAFVIVGTNNTGGEEHQQHPLVMAASSSSAAAAMASSLSSPRQTHHAAATMTAAAAAAAEEAPPARAAHAHYSTQRRIHQEGNKVQQHHQVPIRADVTTPVSVRKSLSGGGDSGGGRRRQSLESSLNSSSDLRYGRSRGVQGYSDNNNSSSNSLTMTPTMVGMPPTVDLSSPTTVLSPPPETASSSSPQQHKRYGRRRSSNRAQRVPASTYDDLVQLKSSQLSPR